MRYERCEVRWGAWRLENERRELGEDRRGMRDVRGKMRDER